MYRRLKDLPVLPTGGRKKIIRAKLEELIGRRFTDEEIEAAQNVRTGEHTPGRRDANATDRTA
jgi:hypothetical protein